MMKLIFYGLFLLMSCGALAGGPEEGKPAPHLEGRYLDGTSFGIQDMQGKVVVVNFWATWCPPCREEMPILEVIYRKYRDQGLEVIGISIDDKADELNVKAAMKPYSYHAALLGAVRADEFGRIWRVPLTFVIDRHGILRKDAWHRESGINASEMEKVVVPLLAEQ